MKLKLLLLFLVVAGFGLWGNAQTTKPYTNLVITEAQMNNNESSYVEFTNMGNETIDLANFEFGSVGAWDGNLTQPFPQATNRFFRLPATTLAPGKSYLITGVSEYNPETWKKDPANYREKVTRKDFFSVKNGVEYSIADLPLHRQESPGPASTDKIDPRWRAFDLWNGRETFYIRHHYLTAEGAKDSTVVDQVGGMFQEANGTNEDHASDVAGTLNATNTCVLIRRNSVKLGNLSFITGRGISNEDSEWIPVPILSGYDAWGAAPWRGVFWTAGNQVNATLTANTLKSKTGKVTVDLANSTITAPWGIRKNDSLTYQFDKTPGLAWGYEYSPNSDDSTYLTARTGDIFKLYVCGDQVTMKEFSIVALAPTPDDNIVVPKTSYDYAHSRNDAHPAAYGGMRVTDGVSPMDSITNLAFAVRVDTLFKYLEKAPKANMKIVFIGGVARPDLKTGDMLQVTSENGKAKNYFVKLEKFVPASNALLASITWPDMPASFKGDVAGNLGWKGDTIPGFLSTNRTYIVQVPLEYNGIPALAFTKQQLDSRVVVSRAKTLAGTVEDRTVTFTVTAENDTVINVYAVRFDKEKDNTNVQPFVGEPFISQIVFRSEWSTGFLEIANPGTEIMDLSNYMITSHWGTEAATWDWNNEYANRYYKYIPGKKWQDEANWLIQPRIVVPDNAVNPIVYPGDVFVMAEMTTCNGWLTPANHPYFKEIDINFGTVPNDPLRSNPWGEMLNGKNIPSVWCSNSIYLYKITNDSVKNGLKPATDRDDFELIESFGGVNTNNWKPDGFDAGSQLVSYTRNPNIYKGNPEPNGSWGDTPATSEWTHKRPSDFSSFNLGWPWTDIAICTGIGAVTLNEITMYRSTVSSLVYKVSEGFSETETIRGLTTGTTVTAFYQNLLKANEGQVLSVTSGGTELGEASVITNGSILTVVSFDGTNTSKYTLSVTEGGLSPNAVLTSTKYTIDVTGSIGTIEGFDKNTLLKTVFEGVTVPAGASLTIVDANDAYMTLTKLTYDTTYVNTLATDKVYFEVVAENGVTKITYQLKPTVAASDAYVTSDVYSVDQFAYVIKFVPVGTSVHSLLANVYPAPGATISVFDKAGFERTSGDIYKDDKLVVTAIDGNAKKVYYFSMLNFYDDFYLAFVTSDAYHVEQVNYKITGPAIGTSIAEFISKLLPSFEATLKVMNEAGTESTLANLATGDVLLVTAADGITTATYRIEGVTGVPSVDVVSTIKMYPNPTTGRVIVQGLAKGNRVRVFNAAGMTLRDVVVENSTDYVSLDAQPAGIYIFVVSAGNQHINIQKIVKK